MRLNSQPESRKRWSSLQGRGEVVGAGAAEPRGPGGQLIPTFLGAGSTMELDPSLVPNLYL